MSRSDLMLPVERAVLKALHTIDNNLDISLVVAHDQEDGSTLFEMLAYRGVAREIETAMAGVVEAHPEFKIRWKIFTDSGKDMLPGGRCIDVVG